MSQLWIDWGFDEDYLSLQISISFIGAIFIGYGWKQLKVLPFRNYYYVKLKRVAAVFYAEYTG